MNSLLKLSAGILLCLPLTGCAGPGYYDPATGMVCSGDMYGPTNMMDDIKCSLSKHRAQRMQKQCCNPCNTCNTCDPCRGGGFGSSIPGMLSSGTFSYGSDDGAMETSPMNSYPTPTYAPQSSCPTCGPQGGQGGTFMNESMMNESMMPEMSSPALQAPTTIVPQKITPVPEHGHPGVINKPAPAPAAEEPMSYVPPALLHAPTMIPNSASPNPGARPVQWVPAQIH
ncbi:hypothetical protein [uncultured Gimesia sp.]|uniref:hypothetical protein n=1 Tax=uncultured Gimesia sp. TaxID=1678688 RepID=UPI0030D9B2C3|tara:strand:+ start:49669 stop:50349 length:681 start_codon:yes stop_codon:yes gene_type:complete